MGISNHSIRSAKVTDRAIVWSSQQFTQFVRERSASRASGESWVSKLMPEKLVLECEALDLEVPDIIRSVAKLHGIDPRVVRITFPFPHQPRVEIAYF